ncbi:TRAP transporter substrate-binding protein [Marinibaculum pumilum]|uniref:TRAP transporter substrate-binding protein n=1 Tax=Marinibaculum pumilum TaxID=1766165 RepID=A0ABV7L7X7_9PROT
MTSFATFRGIGRRTVLAGMAVALPAALALGLSGPAKAAETLTLSSWVPPSHPLTADLLVPWGEAVEKATDGRVKANVLPKAPVKPPQTFDAVKNGVMDVSFVVHGYTPGRFLLTKSAEFPFFGNDAVATSIAYQRMFEKYMADAGEHDGVKVLSVFTHGPGTMFNTTREIDDLSDFDGLKIRVGGGVVNDITKAMGVTSLLKPAPESFELLKNGVVEGVFFPPESVKSFNLQDMIKFATKVPGGLYNTSFVMIMNQAKFDGLPKEDQDAIMSVSGEALARLAGEAWNKADKASWALMDEKGIKVTTANDAFVGEIRGKVDPLQKAWADEVKAKYGLDGMKIVSEMQAEAKKLHESGM